MDAHTEHALKRLQEFLRAHDIISPLASATDLDTAKQALWRLENVPFASDECQLFAYAFGEIIRQRYVARWLHDGGETPRFQVKAGSQALSLDVWGLTQQAFQTSGQSFSEALGEIIDMLDANGAETNLP